MDTLENVKKTYTDATTGKFVMGNPGGGRPKGSFSLKQEIKQYLLDHPEERERIRDYFLQKNPELMWQMIEGRPSQQVDLGVDKEGVAELTKFFREIANKKDDTQSGDGAGSKSEGIPDGSAPVQG